MILEEKSEATVGQLIGALATDTGALVRQELHLAATEMSETAGVAARNAGLLLTGGAFLQVGCIALLAALATGLEVYLPLWASAGILGLVFAGIGIVLLQTGLTALRRLDPLPSSMSTLEPAVFERRESLR